MFSFRPFCSVGKSSAINTILGVSKSSHGVTRVAVSSTPGKTKHFQTLNVSEALMLCDCPGLVFPSFMRSTGEMLCAGILPINQMRDYVEPAEVIASRVPIHLLDAAYGMRIIRELDVKDNPDRPPSPHEMLCAYCAVKGYITNGTGRWDEFRACKDILRDFNDGRLLFVAMPEHAGSTAPSSSSSGAAQRWFAETEKVMVRREKVAERIATMRLKELEMESNSSSSSSGGNGSGGGSGSGSAPAAGSMVFGGDVHDSSDTGFQFYDDSDSDNDDDGGGGGVGDDTTAGAGGDPARDHKRLKRWGKKNKKLRNKTPYGEENGTVAYSAFTTNRAVGLGMSSRASSAGSAANGATSKLSLAGLGSAPTKEFARPIFSFQAQPVSR